MGKVNGQTSTRLVVCAGTFGKVGDCGRLVDCTKLDPMRCDDNVDVGNQAQVYGRNNGRLHRVLCVKTLGTGRAGRTYGTLFSHLITGKGGGGTTMVTIYGGLLGRIFNYMGGGALFSSGCGGGLIWGG